MHGEFFFFLFLVCQLCWRWGCIIGITTSLSTGSTLLQPWYPHFSLSGLPLYSQSTAPELISLELEEDDILVSHDVVSLFTNTPVKESLDIISTRLEQVSDWQDTTMLEKDDILELLEFVLTTTYFAFRGEIYRQKFGTAMGSPVSHLVANMFMEQLERKLSATVPKDLSQNCGKGM